MTVTSVPISMVGADRLAVPAPGYPCVPGFKLNNPTWATFEPYLLLQVADLLVRR